MKNILTIILLLSVAVNSANHYVSTSISGLNNGTSWENAWQDFGSINWNIVQPGDTVFISGGTDTAFYDDTLNIQKSGTYEMPIVYTVGREAGHNGIAYLNRTINAAYSRNHWVLDGSNGNPQNRNLIVSDTTGAENVSIYLSNSIKIRKIDVRNGKNHGIRINYKSYHIEIDSCYIRNQVWDGINITVADTLDNLTNPYEVYKIKNCVISNIGDDLIQLGTSGVTIEKCALIHGGKETPEGAHPDGVQINPGQRYVNVNGCTIVNCPQGVFIERTSGFIKVYNNVFYETEELQTLYNRAISLNEHDAGAIGIILIANNVFYNHQWTAILFYQDTFEVDDSLIITNNIFQDCVRYFLGNYNPVHIRGDNFFFSSSQVSTKTSAAVPDSGRNVDPLFYDYKKFDFRLQQCSPAINAGSDLSSWFTQDKDGTMRVYGNAWDAGPFEFVGLPDTEFCRSSIRNFKKKVSIKKQVNEPELFDLSGRIQPQYGSANKAMRILINKQNSGIIKELVKF